MLKFYEKEKIIEVLLGFGDVGVGQCDGSPEESGYMGVAFTQLSRVYGKDEEIPDSEKEASPLKVVLTILDEAGYSILNKAVKKLGTRKGYDKYSLGDKIFDNLMDDLGVYKQKVMKAEYEAKQYKEALEKIYSYKSDNPDCNTVKGIAWDAIYSQELVES